LLFIPVFFVIDYMLAWMAHSVRAGPGKLFFPSARPAFLGHVFVATLYIGVVLVSMNFSLIPLLALLLAAVWHVGRDWKAIGKEIALDSVPLIDPSLIARNTVGAGDIMEPLTRAWRPQSGWKRGLYYFGVALWEETISGWAPSCSAPGCCASFRPQRTSLYLWRLFGAGRFPVYARGGSVASRQNSFARPRGDADLQTWSGWPWELMREYFPATIYQRHRVILTWMLSGLMAVQFPGMVSPPDIIQTISLYISFVFFVLLHWGWDLSFADRPFQYQRANVPWRKPEAVISREAFMMELAKLKVGQPVEVVTFRGRIIKGRFVAAASASGFSSEYLLIETRPALGRTAIVKLSLDGIHTLAKRRRLWESSPFWIVNQHPVSPLARETVRFRGMPESISPDGRYLLFIETNKGRKSLLFSMWKRARWRRRADVSFRTDAAAFAGAGSLVRFLTTAVLFNGIFARKGLSCFSRRRMLWPAECGQIPTRT
jgi:hypothetical protein